MSQPQDPREQHRDMLRNYLLAKTRYLMMRGIIRQSAGASLEDVLRNEIPAVLGEVESDILAILAEAGISFLSAAKSAFLGMLLPRR